ncbi:O-antigen ligase family protein [Pseudidiomarina tainanensis]|uniref:O-antigen ligase family protein n=1 Tax=Pseudidiomarina tainanensis TaxID=502365 RepID=UPI00102A9394|nr:O-antigen ligase family protein [Pseudidiomarina tainanensis]
MKLLLLVVILSPAKDILEFYAVLFLLVVFTIGLYGVSVTRFDVYCLLVFFLVLFLLFIFRYFIIGIENFDYRDILEYGRVFFLVIIYISVKKIRLNLSDLILILKVYLLTDFVLSSFQFFDVGGRLIDLATDLYSTRSHVENALYISRRSLGLSPDPGTHGLMVLFITIILSVNYFFQLNSHRSNDLIYILIGYVTILMSQSQTAFVGLLFFVFTLIFTLFYYRNYLISRRRAVLFLCLLVLLAACVIIMFSNELRYLFTLFSQGLERSSYQARGEKTIYIWHLMSESPLGLISGYGKEFFGNYSRAMDNEHLYILAVWGLVIYSIFAISLLFSILRYFKRENSISLFFTLPFIIGIPLAWPSSYYLVPKISLLLVIFYTHYRQERNL